MKHPIVSQDLTRIIETKIPWERLANKTVLITGANGFLPAYMLETLLCLNDIYKNFDLKVIALVRNLERYRQRFQHCLHRQDINVIVQDINYPVNIAEHIDYIIHAASQASPKYYGTDPVGTLSANVFGTRNLLELGRSNGVDGFLYFSSGEVYGEVTPMNIPTGEDDYGYLDPIEVRSCYSESKRMGETMCVCWAAQYGMNVKIVRPFHTYGPGMRLDDGRVFADFVADVVQSRPIEVKSAGLARRAFCYLSDATAGFFTVLLKGESRQAYNVGNERAEISIIDLAHKLVDLFPEKSLRVVQNMTEITSGYIPSKITRNCPDISKIRSLGWEPLIGLDEGFKRTIESFM